MGNHVSNNRTKLLGKAKASMPRDRNESRNKLEDDYRVK